MSDKQTRDAIFSSKKWDWGTPWSFFRKIDDIFHFTLDVCASDWNAKCERYFTEEDDGLTQPWGTPGNLEMCFMNPPYGKEYRKATGKDIWDWMKRAYYEWRRGRARVVCLIPARTDTIKTWHRYAFKAPYILFIEGRIHHDAGPAVQKKSGGTFPSALVIYSELTPNQIRRLFKFGVLMEKVKV